MASLERIRTDGFKRWYERQLVECHAWLVSGFLGLIVLVSGLELFGSGATRILGLALLAAGLVLVAYSWSRYRAMLATAERLGEQAVCPGCGHYARFNVLASRPTVLPDGSDPELEAPGNALWLRAHCRVCGREWLIR